MAFNVEIAKLTGNPDESGWSQVHDFKPEDSIKLKVRGRLFAVISTTNKEEGVDSVAAGRELLGRLHEEYFGSLDKSAFLALKSAVEKVTEEFSSAWGDVELAAASLVGDVLYISVSGGGQVWVGRNGKLTALIKSRSSEVNSASGKPKLKDVLVLGTSRFFKNFDKNTLKGYFVYNKPNAILENLAPQVHLQNQEGKFAVALIGFFEDAREKRLEELEVGEEKQDATVAQKQLKKEELENKPLGDKNKNPISRFISKKLDRKVSVKQEEFNPPTQKRRVSVSVGIILLLLLCVSIFFGVRQKKQNDYKNSYQTRLDKAKHEYEEAVSIYSLNPQRARELFLDSKNLVDALISENVEDQSLKDLKTKIVDSEGSVLGEYNEDPKLFVDLSLLSSGFVGKDLASSDNLFYVLDSKGERVVSVAFDTKRTEVVAGPDEIQGVYDIAAYADRVFVVDKNGIRETGLNKAKIDTYWEGEVIAYAYAGNMYVLDKVESTIWRHSGVASGFAAKTSWLAPGITPDLIGVVSWTIDGSIWFLTSSGRVLKYTNGNPQPFDVQGLVPEFSNPKDIYTGDEFEYLYILDPDNSRVVVLSKDGLYKAQYISDKIKDATQLAVSEKEKKIILLTGDKLLYLEIKHM